MASGLASWGRFFFPAPSDLFATLANFFADRSSSASLGIKVARRSSGERGILSAKGTLIVCSCNLITSKDLAEAVVSLRSRDPFVVLTPSLIYRHLGKRPCCGHCLPLMTQVAASEMEAVTTAGISSGTAEGLVIRRRDEGDTLAGQPPTTT
jgi:bacterioferritin-associated ferredoxin